MMQDYDFMPTLEGKSTNTSSKSVSTPMQPSLRVVQNILNFARCCENINVNEVKIKLFLN